MTIDSLPADLAAFQHSYEELFGVMPPLPAAKFDSIPDIDSEALRLAEQQRAHAFYSDVFDIKTTQLMLYGMLLFSRTPAVKFHALLMLYGMLLFSRTPAVKFHALAAHQAGATRKELQKVGELAASAAAFGPMNNSGAVLKELRVS